MADINQYSTGSAVPGLFGPEAEARKRRLAEQVQANLSASPNSSAPAPAESGAPQPPLASTVVPGANAAQPTDTTQKEPSAAMQTPGSSPPPSSEVGGVSDTVAQTQDEVNNLLGRKPSARKLRDAVDAYEASASALRGRDADTSSIDAALERAKQGYEEKVSRNEMLSLVQMIAQGFSKLAAYNYGAGKGRYIADQVNVPSVDYEKRNDRALDELKLEQGEGERRRSAAERAADRGYGAGKDKANSLKERIGAEETAFGRESAMYDSELNAARQRNSDATHERGADKRDQSLEEKFNRQFGAKEVDNVQQEEAVLRQKEQAVNALAGAIAGDDKRSRQAIPALAAKAGVTPEEIEKFRADSEQKGIIWDSADPKAAAKALSNSLLPGVRERLDALRKRKEAATEMMRTGESQEQVRSRLGVQSATQSSGKVIRSKSTKETRPYSEELWKKISASPQSGDFEVVGN